MFSIDVETCPRCTGPMKILAFVTEPRSQNSSALFGTGGLFQVDLTTTLALTARAGATNVHGDLIGDFALGVSIY